MAPNVQVFWKTFVIILVPLVLLPIPLFVSLKSPDPEKYDADRMVQCLYVAIIMGIFWTCEVVPLTVTALVPLIAFPLLQIETAKKTANAYVIDISFLFIGGLMIAVAIEETNLHRRLALNILLRAGAAPGRLLAGVMATTAFLSMWISNTATTAMMVPVIEALLAELIRTQRNAKRFAYVSDGQAVPVVEMTNRVAPVPAEPRPSTSTRTDAVVISEKTLSKSELNLCKCMLLAVAYSASLGGTATLTGTPPNIVMTGLLNKAYGSGHPINYASWIAYNGPGMLINITFAFFWLQLLFLGPRTIIQCFTCKTQSDAASEALKGVLKTELNTLGSIGFGEISVIGWFMCLLLMWFTHSPLWKDAFKIGDVAYTSDATCAMIIVFILFCWPKQMPDFRAFVEGRKAESREAILTWKAVERRLPWGVVLLLGGGFALGGAVKSTGLALLIGNQLSALKISNVGICIVSLILMTYTTEFTSNTATSNIILPITMSVAEKRCINPLYLTMPVSEAASFAYMLPVATPPSAIVFSTGVLKVTDMIKAGFVMNIVCMCEVLLSIHTWGWHMFGIGDPYPLWAGNSTGCL